MSQSEAAKKAWITRRSPIHKAWNTRRRTGPAKKAIRTDKWARTLTKVRILRGRHRGVRWNVIDFQSRKKRESSGIVDLMAVRKDHRQDAKFKRGDLFEIILIQVKGGRAAEPSSEDCRRLLAVAKRYRAKAIVLSTWDTNRRRRKVEFRVLRRGHWIEPEADIFM